MERPREQLLASASFTAQEDAGSRGGNLLELSQRRPQRATLADDFVEAIDRRCGRSRECAMARRHVGYIDRVLHVRFPYRATADLHFSAIDAISCIRYSNIAEPVGTTPRRARFTMSSRIRRKGNW